MSEAKPTILLAAADSDSQRSLRLASIGVTEALCLFFDTPEELLAQLRRDRPDIVALDAALAERDDYALLKRIRSHEGCAGLPFLVLAPLARMAEFDRPDKGLHPLPMPLDSKTFASRVKALVAPGSSWEATTSLPCAAPLANIDPKATLLFRRGCAKLKERKAAEAFRDFAEAVKYEPNFPEALKAMATALKALGHADKAFKAYCQAAMVYALTQRFDEAEKLYLALKKTGPKTPNPFLKAGRKLLEQGRGHEALSILVKATETAPDDLDAWVALSDAYVKSGDKAKAIETIHRFLQNHRDSAQAAELYQTLTGEDWYGALVAVDAEGEEVQILEDETQREIFIHLRQTPRIPLADFSVVIDKQLHLPVVDISEGGVGFKPLQRKFSPGDSITFDIESIMGGAKIKGLKAIVRRITRGKVVGCEFAGLSHKQSKQLKKTFFSE